METCQLKIHDNDAEPQSFINFKKLSNLGEIVDTPMSHLNEIRIDSDLDLLVLTPDTGAVVTFVTHTPSAPLSRNLDCSLVSEN